MTHAPIRLLALPFVLALLVRVRHADPAAARRLRSTNTAKEYNNDVRWGR